MCQNPPKPLSIKAYSYIRHVFLKKLGITYLCIICLTVIVRYYLTRGFFMSSTKRISITIPVDVLESADSICSRMGVSRSSYISEVVRESSDKLNEFLDFVLIDENADNGVRTRDPKAVQEYLSRTIDAHMSSLLREGHISEH